MSEILEQLAICIERGKVDKNAAYPPDMKDQDGASELTKAALDQGISPNDILKKSMMVAMNRVGEKFEKGQAFIPELLIAAKAMNAGMVHLKPYFDSGEAEHRGTVVIGTVSGDLHDIGKNIVRMVLEGDGWKVIDLGVDAGADKFIKAVKENKAAIVGMSALLTTTMINMEAIAKALKEKFPEIKVFVGGAPLSDDFSKKIGADGYFPEPHSFAKHLAKSA